MFKFRKTRDLLLRPLSLRRPIDFSTFKGCACAACAQTRVGKCLALQTVRIAINTVVFLGSGSALICKPRLGRAMT